VDETIQERLADNNKEALAGLPLSELLVYENIAALKEDFYFFVNGEHSWTTQQQNDALMAEPRRRFAKDAAASADRTPEFVKQQKDADLATNLVLDLTVPGLASVKGIVNGIQEGNPGEVLKSLAFGALELVPMAASVRAVGKMEGAIARGTSATQTGGARFATMGGAVGPEFNPQQLQRILRNLERRGVVIDTGADALRLLEREGAGAMYMVDNGRRGVLILRPGARRLQVMEELVHHGQHVRAGLQLPTDTAALSVVRLQREIEAQDILLRIARNQTWTAEEIARITANRQVFVEQLTRLTGR
jgi:hypothetical protein